MGYRLWVIGFVAVLTACSTTSSLPSIDDAYYQPEKTTYTSHTSTSGSTSSTSSNIEYINVQDTTVTIRIKR